MTSRIDLSNRGRETWIPVRCEVAMGVGDKLHRNGSSSGKSYRPIRKGRERQRQGERLSPCASCWRKVCKGLDLPTGRSGGGVGELRYKVAGGR